MSEFVAVCTAGEVGLNTAKRVRLNDVNVAVVHAEDGFFAIADRCSHADVSLADGEVYDCAIECWLHGSAFDLRTGVPLSLPAIEPVATYALRLVGDGDAAVVEIDPTPIRAAASAPGH